jgi:3-methyladenine DNA glycosylase AlkD
MAKPKQTSRSKETVRQATTDVSARQFVKELKTLDQDKADKVLSVPMRQVFALAKEFMNMPPSEIETLLEHDIHEARVGAVSIMDFQARSKKISQERRRELFELYLRRHDRINTWDLVDRAAPYVIGGYLDDKPREPLYKLARSKDMWERRTAIVSTYFFIRQGDVKDTFGIAELLVHDEHDLSQRAVGGWVREAGKKDSKKLLNFLDKYAATMPRTALRYAVEHLEQKQREHYMNLRKAK